MGSNASQISETSGPRPAFSSNQSLTTSCGSTDYDTDDTLENIPSIPTDSDDERPYRLPRRTSKSPPRKRYSWPKTNDNWPDWLRGCDELERAERIDRMKIAAQFSGNREVIKRLRLYLTPVPRPSRRDMPRFSDFRRGNQFNPRKRKFCHLRDWDGESTNPRRQLGDGQGDLDNCYKLFGWTKDEWAVKSAGRRLRNKNFAMKQKQCEKWEATDEWSVDDTGEEIHPTKSKRTVQSTLLDIAKLPFYWHIQAFKVYKKNNRRDRELKYNSSRRLNLKAPDRSNENAPIKRKFSFWHRRTDKLISEPEKLAKKDEACAERVKTPKTKLLPKLSRPASILTNQNDTPTVSTKLELYAKVFCGLSFWPPSLDFPGAAY